MQKPYFQTTHATIYHGNMAEIVPDLGKFDAIVTDPPYGETSLGWDRWVDNWPGFLASVSPVLWCFGSMRMFLTHISEFSDWNFAQDLVWEKHNGSSGANDRFRRVHETALQFYRGAWGDIYKRPVMTNDATKRTVRRKKRPTHWGNIDAGSYRSEDGGPRLQRSVIPVRSCHGYAVHPTQKPLDIVLPLIEYSVPPDGRVLDPFAGSGTTLIAAMARGLTAVGIDADEESCEKAAIRLLQETLENPL